MKLNQETINIHEKIFAVFPTSNPNNIWPFLLKEEYQQNQIINVVTTTSAPQSQITRNWI